MVLPCASDRLKSDIAKPLHISGYLYMEEACSKYNTIRNPVAFTCKVIVIILAIASQRTCLPLRAIPLQSGSRATGIFKEYPTARGKKASRRAKAVGYRTIGFDAGASSTTTVEIACKLCRHCVVGEGNCHSRIRISSAGGRFSIRVRGGCYRWGTFGIPSTFYCRPRK